MIWITGDKHGQLDPFLENPTYKKIKKNDTLIICGDFGFLWDRSKQELKNLKWLSKRRFNIAFVDGCHDNQTILSEYPTEFWNGGKIRRVSKNILYLMRGEIYDIDGARVLAFGGGHSENRAIEAKGKSWWPEESPSREQIDNVVENMQKARGYFDLIISHEAPRSIKSCLEENYQDSSPINDVLEEIRAHCDFKNWFFGKYHVDKLIPPKYHVVFDDVIKFEKRF